MPNRSMPVFTLIATGWRHCWHARTVLRPPIKNQNMRTGKYSFTKSTAYVSRSQAAPSGMPHLTCGTIFLLLFVFLISSILHHHPALLHRHTLIPDRLLTFFRAVFHYCLKISLFWKSFPPCPFSAWSPGIMTTRCLVVNGGGSVGKCSRLSQHSWLLLRTII